MTEATKTKYPPGAGLGGYTKERAESELGALQAEKLGLERRKAVAKEDGLDGVVKKCDRRLGEVDVQIKAFEKLVSSAPTDTA